MAVRIQLRRDTAANWVSADPVLRAGEIGIETDTLKFKIGTGATWTATPNYANVTPSGLSNSLNQYILAADQGAPGGPAELDSNGDLVIPENSIILWNDADYTYNTTVTATQPTEDRTITLPNNSGTVALTSDIVTSTTGISEGTNLYFTDDRAAGTHTNISVSYNDNAGSISLTGAQTYSNEDAVDAVAAAIAAGTQTNISVTYDDANNSISFNASGGVSSLTGTANEVEVSASTGAITVGLPNDVTISNNLTVTGDIAAADSLQLTTNAAEGSATGKLIWDDGEGVPAIGLKGGNVDLKIGSQEVALCYNGTGSTIAKGSVVYISGAQGQRPRISLSDADTEATSSKTFGVVAESIADGAEGFVTTFGIVAGIDTSAFTVGDALWLSSTAGGLTATKPSAPVHSVFVGYCLNAHASSGRIFVNPQNGYELQELHNVAISSVANDDVLKYDSTLGVWKNTKTLSITDLTLSGNLTVNGTTTTVNTSDLVVNDPLIYIGEGNTGNSVDLGFVSSFNNGTYQHSGLVRDASDNKWKLFKGVTDEPTTTVNFTQGSLDTLAVATLEGNVSGNLTGNVTGNVTGNLTGNADTVTNGVYTTGSYADPAWITGLAWSKISSTPTTVSGYGITNAAVLNASNTFTSDKNTFAAQSATSDAIIDLPMPSGQAYPGILTRSNTSWITALNPTGLDSYWQARFQPQTTSTVPLYVKGLASQTANLQEWRNSSGTVLANIDSSGNFVIGRSGSGSLGNGLITLQGVTAQSLYSSDNTSALNSRIIFLRGNSAGTVMSITSKGDTAHGVAALVITNGGFSTEITGFGYNGNIYTNLQSATAVGLTIKAASSQSANLQEWQNSSGTVLAKVQSNGVIDTSQYINMSTSGNAGIAVGGIYRIRMTNGNTRVQSSNGAITTLTVEGVASQTANLQEWQNSSGTVLASVNASGQFVGDGSQLTGLTTALTTPSTVTLSANTATTVDTTALSGFTSLEYMVSLKQGSKVRTSKVVLQTDGTSVDMTEFAITETGGTMSGVVISATTSGSDAVLQATVTDASSTNVTVKLAKIKL
jgi:hypothetical protein